jgi:hypothetical protein
MVRKESRQKAVTGKKPLPFEFVLEALIGLHPVTKPMFGCHAVYVDHKIVLILRERVDHTKDNGVWIATTKAHHQSLKNDFPSLRSIGVLGGGETAWQILPLDADDFEESVSKVCQFIKHKDPRIGKIPKAKKPRKVK